MLFMSEEELKTMLEKEFARGVLQGKKLMEERMLLACENGHPLDINGRAYFVRSDIQNLYGIFEDLDGEN